MSVVARFSVPADQFPLGRALDVRPGTEVRLESVIPVGEAVLPYFWAPVDDAEAIVETLRAAAFTETVEVVDRTGEEALFRVEWSPDVDGFVEAITESGATLLEGTGHDDGWSFRLRFAGSEALSAFYRDCSDEGLTLELENVRRSEESPSEDLGLTDEQYEAVVTAFEEGYFAVPRETTLVELAAELGVSDSAVSQRLRRGLASLLAATIEGGRSDASTRRGPDA
jgi:predicted DNA binding protein